MRCRLSSLPWPKPIHRPPSTCCKQCPVGAAAGKVSTGRFFPAGPAPIPSPPAQRAALLPPGLRARRRPSGRRVHLGKRQSGSGLCLGQHFADRSGARQRAANHFFCLGKQGSTAGREHDRGIAARADARSRGRQHRAPMGPERPGRGSCLGARAARRRRQESRSAQRSLELGTNATRPRPPITSPRCRAARRRKTPSNWLRGNSPTPISRPP